jgi:hypothetical protein
LVVVQSVVYLELSHEEKKVLPKRCLLDGGPGLLRVFFWGRLVVTPRHSLHLVDANERLKAQRGSTPERSMAS